jgi:hypothetical protein
VAPPCRLLADSAARDEMMAGWRQAIELAMGEADFAALRLIACARKQHR